MLLVIGPRSKDGIVVELMNGNGANTVKRAWVAGIVSATIHGRSLSSARVLGNGWSWVFYFVLIFLFFYFFIFIFRKRREGEGE